MLAGSYFSIEPPVPVSTFNFVLIEPLIPVQGLFKILIGPRVQFWTRFFIFQDPWFWVLSKIILQLSGSKLDLIPHTST